MTIRRKFVLLSLLTGAAIAVLAFSIWGQNWAAHRLQDVQQNRYDSYLLADEMRRSSDDLTRLARTYVVSGDPAYKKQYMQILAIRNGQAPRPQNYERIYWDFVADGQDNPRPLGPPAPLLDLMKAAGFSAEEFAQLEQAKANSDGLVNLEVQAMDLVEGKDRGGSPTEADLAKARELLHSKAYHHFKAQIMAPVDKFFALLDERTSAEVARTQQIVSDASWLSAAAAFAVLAMAASSCLFIARGVFKPLGMIRHSLVQISEGHISGEVPGRDRHDEIGEMAKAVLVFQQAAIENANLASGAAEHQARAEGERARSEQAQRDAIEQERAIVASSIGAALAKLAAKDLTYRMPADIPDAYRKLQTDFNAAIAELETAMRSLTGSTDAIHSGTREISAAADDLSRRTEQQAASLEETAAALDEITATVKRSAEGATHAREVVAAADKDAKQSAVVVRQAVDAMDAIAKSAQQISQIIGVIDEIAFQTNLLALNAGVEAARAGEAGRGFAVVASEVRALAQRSAEAAKEIKGLISASTTQVDHGVKLVAETGASLERIMAQVTEINSVVGEIAAGAQEQATGLQQINTAINQMDQTTQQNASMVEESTAASHSLSQETHQLSGLIGQFQLGRTTDGTELRRQLQKAAPHAFRQPAKGAIGSGTEPRVTVARSAMA